jgi:predicted acylesterase/phospholipase RssA
MNKKYDAIVLEAGGIKGISLLGFLHVLYNEMSSECTENVKYITGTSCGAAIAFLLCIGYTPREIFLYITINDILDIFSNFSILSLPTQYGMVNSDSLKKYIELMAIKKIGYIPTFNDLYIKFGKFFMCPAYNINGSSKEERCQYFSVINKGEMLATDAVLLSCSIPLVITKSLYNNNIYIDGAIFDGCPVMKTIEMFNLKNENILCLRFWEEKKTISSVSSIYSYIKSVFESLMENTKQTIETKENIEIAEINPGVGALDFDLSKLKRVSLFVKGQETAQKHYKIHSEEFGNSDLGSCNSSDTNINVQNLSNSLTEKENENKEKRD